MDDPVLVTSIGLALLPLLVLFMARRKAYKSSTKWRKAFAGCLWAVNAMLFGGAASQIEKGKVVKARKRDLDDQAPLP